MSLFRADCLWVAGYRELEGQERVLLLLLGDGRPALLHAFTLYVPVDGPGDAYRVDAGVGEELAVLGGEHGVDEDLRHLAEGDRDPVLLAGELGHGVVGAAALDDVGGAHERGLQQRVGVGDVDLGEDERSEEHTAELQSLMRISYAVFCVKKN